MTIYITYPVETNASVLLQECYDYLQAHVPGWTPAEGNLDVWLAEAVSTEVSDLTNVASKVPDTIFKYFGSTLMGIPPVDATSATTTTTWTMRDNKGYLIPANTQVSIKNAQGVSIAFQTLADVTVPAGSTATAAGEVIIQGMIPGANTSGLGGAGATVDLVDILDFVVSITMTQITSGGQDAETDADYLNRLTTELSVLTRTPILPQDYATLTRFITPTYRAVALDGYNPANDTLNNPRMVAVSAIDSNGNALSAPDKTNIKNYLQSLREVNFIVNMMDPTYTLIDVTTNVHMVSGYTSANVISAVTTAITNYLSPANWGLPSVGTDTAYDPRDWINRTVVRKFEVSQVINDVPGVDYIVPNGLSLGVHLAAMGEQDVTLAGRITLPRPSTITVTTS